jgi:hypothetical protein
MLFKDTGLRGQPKVASHLAYDCRL